MDKLQWFKFSYADWRMGKIQKCPEITQARFVNLCCLYWSKDCFLSYDDAEIEIDKEHLDILINKKIITNANNFISISFLDEQFAEIEETNKNKSKSGVLGNLKRWHKDIYKKYESREITLKEAISLSKNIAHQSHPDNTPIAPQSQNIAEKRRGEERREDNIYIGDKQKFLSWFNKRRTEYLKIPSHCNTWSRNDIANHKELKRDYTIEQFEKAMKSFCKDKFYLDSNNILPNYFLQPEKFVKFLNAYNSNKAIQPKAGDPTTW